MWRALRRISNTTYWPGPGAKRSPIFLFNIPESTMREKNLCDSNDHWKGLLDFWRRMTSRLARLPAAAVTQGGSLTGDPTWLGWIRWKLLNHNFSKNFFSWICIWCIFGHWWILNKMNFSKKWHFLPEKCIFLTKFATWPPGQHGTTPVSRNIFFCWYFSS